MVKALLKLGANVNAVDSENETPLSICKKYEFHNIAELLLKVISSLMYLIRVLIQSQAGAKSDQP
jgi:ankyrin repeat protein